MEKGDVKKASSLMMCAVFAGFLLFFAAGFIMLPYQGVNYTEQRDYAKMPELTFDALNDGTFTEGLESYLTDHLVLREELVTLSSDLGAVFGRTLPELAYKGSGGQYFLRYRENTEGMNRTLEAFAAYAEKQTVPVDLLLIPDAELMLSEQLPAGAVNDDQEASVRKIVDSLNGCMNICSAEEKLALMKEQGKQLYYKTDHHWTTDCAKEVFEWYMEQSGQKLRDVSYKENTVEGFYGSLYSSAPSFFASPDTLKYYTNESGSYKVEWLDKDESSDTFYNTDWLIGVKNKYNIFFGGDFRHLRITSDAPEGKVLVLADSYAMAVIPFIADCFSETEVIDIRSLDSNEKTVAEMIGDFEPDRIVFIDSVFQITCGSMQNFG